MRHGEIVRTNENRIGRYEAIETNADSMGLVFGTVYQPEDLEIVTVAELFSAAELPVPDGKFPLLYDDVDDNWYRPDFVWFDGDKWVVADGIADRAKSPDLSRLPALDAWDALPEPIKAVVR